MAKANEVREAKETMVGMKGMRSLIEAKRSAQTGMTTDLRETEEGKLNGH